MMIDKRLLVPVPPREGSQAFAGLCELRWRL